MLLELCTIQEVDTKNMLVSAYFLSSRRLYHGIVYTYPAMGMGSGIFYAPTPGAIGIVTTVNSVPIIIGYTGPMKNTGKDTVTRAALGAPDLLDGEIMLTTAPNSWLKLGAEGEITIHVNGADSVYTPSGDIIMNAANKITKNIGNLCITEGVHKYKTGVDDETEVELIYSIVVAGKLTFGIDSEGREYHGS